MSRPWPLLIALAILTGCQGASPTIPADAVFGRTRVEPPKTGAVGTAAAATLPEPQAAVGSTSASPLTERDSSVSRNNDWTSRPPTGALTDGADRVRIPESARRAAPLQATLVGQSSTTPPPADAHRNPTPAAAATSSAVATAGASAGNAAAAIASGESNPGRERITRTLQTRPADSTDASAATPGLLPNGQGTIDIMSLPSPGSSAQGSASVPRDGVQHASATVETADSVADAAIVSDARYGHASDYRWLRGRLEYSEIDRQWKLRYIPIDGATDDYGGSVVIANATALADYRRGEFVEVKGSLAEEQPNPERIAPYYQVSEIRRMAR